MSAPITASSPSEIISDQYDGRTRRLFLKACLRCQAGFYTPKHADKKYCTVDCKAKSTRTRVRVECSWCAVKFERTRSDYKNSKSGLQFCSRVCKDRAQRIGGLEEIQPEHYGKGITDYRRNAFQVYGARCRKCGYSKSAKMLDVDHIDSDRQNGDIRNLQVLCVWCHALKTRGVTED